MKKILTSLSFCMLAAGLLAAPLFNIPQTLVQPNGDTLHCLASGDEFFHYLHDANGYTIVQDPATGYFVYAVESNGNMAPSKYVAGKSNPTQLNLKVRALPSEQKLKEIIDRKRALYKADEPVALANTAKAPASYVKNQGTLNNIVVFIKFSDESSYVFKQLSFYDNICSGSGMSMRTYFEEVSYNLLSIPSTYYPIPNGQVVLSYQDANPRNYYRPYSSGNTIGYKNDSEYTAREHALLANAIQAIASQVPANIDLDINGDGKVDNVSFILSKGSDGWADLLWPHRWSLYSESVYIHGKRVYDYLFVPSDDFNVSTLCHETFHALSAPDLYHYYNYTNLSPVYTWDIMERNATPPQHMCAYMKYKYGNWITIPTITTPGKYTLSPLHSSSTNNCYKIPIPGNSQQFYVVEYRQKTSSGFESSIPGTGLIVYRIDTRFDGNANFNGSSSLDGVYAFRPGGAALANGTPTSAHFSSYAGRTAFNKTTNPAPWLNSSGSESYTSITEISGAGETISFVYGQYGKVAHIDISVANIAYTGELTPFEITEILPSDAADKTIAWSIINGTGSAEISGNNIIGRTTGTITLKATAQDGGGAYATKEIQVEMGQTILISSINITTPSSIVAGEPNSLSAEVLPVYATNTNLTWEVFNGTGSAHISDGKLIGDTPGTIKVRATAQDGSDIYAEKEITIIRLVSTIEITTPATITTNTQSPLSATVYPADATDKTIVWSIAEQSGKAHIDGNYLVGDKYGTILLTATSADLAGVSNSKEITVQPRYKADEKNTVIASWVNNYGEDGNLYISYIENIGKIEIYSLSGVKMKEFKGEQDSFQQISFAGIPKGTYVVVVWNSSKDKHSSTKIAW